MQQVIRPDAKVEHIPRFHAVWIVIVILRAREWTISALRERDQLGSDHALFAAGAGAIRERIRHRGRHSVAGQADRHLLIRRQRQAAATMGTPLTIISAIGSIGECDPLRVLRALIAQIHRRLERLIVIDPEHAAG